MTLHAVYAYGGWILLLLFLLADLYLGRKTSAALKAAYEGLITRDKTIASLSREILELEEEIRLLNYTEETE